MKRASQRRRAWIFIPALLLLFALAGQMLPAVPGPVAKTGVALEIREEEPCSTVPTGQKLITLTFDDGPRRSTATRLLDGLSEHEMKTTFFLIRAQIENNGGVMRRMDKKGHQVGIHTFDHVKLTDLSRTDFDAQVEIIRALFKPTLGHSDLLLRPPCDMLDESAKVQAGYPIILWSVDPEDWWDQNVDRVMREVMAGTRDDGIILIHDIFPESVNATLQIVDQFHQQDYLFCAVDELFTARDLPLEAREMYWNTYP